MTLDEAIKHAEEVADKKEREKQKWEKWLENDSDYRAVAEKVSCELCAEEHRQLAEWLKELKQLREQTRWIPVSERLPEDGTYLICTDDDYIATIMYDRSMGWLLDSNIIAWMPLPQPYKGESEEEQ